MFASILYRHVPPSRSGGLQQSVADQHQVGKQALAEVEGFKETIVCALLLLRFNA